MEIITKFKAIDGKEFNTKNECIDYEILIDKVNKIMSLLPHPIDDDSFFNGGGYIQHCKANVKLSRINLLNLYGQYIKHPWIQQSIDNDKIDPSLVSRLLSDCNINPFIKSWNRLSCVDAKYREWGQPYFAQHPEEGVQKCLFRVDKAIGENYFLKI